MWASWASGSSPRVRGKGQTYECAILPTGIIPAGAGKSKDHFAAYGGAGDHPRGCGEKGLTPVTFIHSRGSSPRVRGKDIAHSYVCRQARIIPAGAGKRRNADHHRRRRRDHPRGCGEKPPAAVSRGRRGGSSPRVRGKEFELGEGWTAARIIPAGAGKSSISFHVFSPMRDHPRGCGEKFFGELSPLRDEGSSPRVRGKEETRKGGEAAGGIIPAGAGKRPHLVALSVTVGDHPRGCGEKKC